MQAFLSNALRLSLLLGCLTPLAGCEAQECDNPETGADGVCLKSLKRFTSPAESDSAAYGGGDASIDSPNGNVLVVRGSSANVVATFEPFVLRAYDTAPADAQANIDELERSIEASGEDVIIDVTRPDGSPPTLGADITAELPASFVGNLRITQNNGQTQVDDVVGAVGVLVTSDNGSCDIATGAAADVSVHCDNGDLSASIEAATAQSGSGFSTGNGAITLALPTDGVYSVQAQALAGGTVSVENLPSGCSVASASDSAKTLSCNGATSNDPVYEATADGTSLADVVLVF